MKSFIQHSEKYVGNFDLPVLPKVTLFLLFSNVPKFDKLLSILEYNKNMSLVCMALQ